MTTELRELYLHSLYFEACVLFEESMRTTSELEKKRLAREHAAVKRLWRSVAGAEVGLTRASG
jgi:hypothetical protein